MVGSQETRGSGDRVGARKAMNGLHDIVLRAGGIEARETVSFYPVQRVNDAPRGSQRRHVSLYVERCIQNKTRYVRLRLVASLGLGVVRRRRRLEDARFGIVAAVAVGRLFGALAAQQVSRSATVI